MVTEHSLFDQDRYKPVCFLEWKEAFQAGLQQVGGKAWNLCRLYRYGFDVPTFGVIPVTVWQQFVKENDLTGLIDEVSAAISLANIHQTATQEKLEALREKIQSGALPSQVIGILEAWLSHTGLSDRPVAVRSSATCEDSDQASFAGIHESFLNATGLDPILQRVKACFASLWNVQAVAYRRKMAIDDHEVLPAVVIMKMIDADAAGVAFSCDPVSGRTDIFLINANFGLGESVVNGVTEPDSYCLDNFDYTTKSQIKGRKEHVSVALKTGGTRLAPNLNENKEVLDESQRERLGLLVQRIFDALGGSEQHQDIEWAIKDNCFYLLQARPVTALPIFTCDEISNQRDVWSNANFRDAVPMVQTQWQRQSTDHLVNHMMLCTFPLIGYRLQQGLRIGKHIQGRLYCHISLYQWLMYDALGVLPKDLNLMMGGHQPEIALPQGSPYLGIEGVRRVIRLLRFMRLTRKYKKHEQRHYDAVNRFADDFEKLDLSTVSDFEYMERIRRGDRVSVVFGAAYMFLSSGTSPLMFAIKQLEGLFPGEGAAIVNALATGRGNITSANQGYDLLEFSEIAAQDPQAKQLLLQRRFDAESWKELPNHSPFKQAFADYLQKFGHRAAPELDMSIPRWREEPGFLLKNIARATDGPSLATIRHQQQKMQRDAQARLRQRIGFLRRKIINNLVQQGIEGSEMRERAKSLFVRFVATGRLMALEAGKRLHARGVIEKIDDIFHCSRAEVFSIMHGEWDGTGLKYLVTERSQTLQEQKRMPPPDVIIDDKQQFVPPMPDKNDNTYSGVGVSAGVAQGMVRIVLAPDESDGLQPGEVLVAPSTDPSWTPLFLNACAIVLETGGYTSHGSIVAREYGIPAVVNVAGVLSLLKNGDRVQVNGNKGEVYIQIDRGERS